MRTKEQKKQDNMSVCSFKMDREVKSRLRLFCERKGLRLGKTVELLILKFLEEGKA